METFENLKRGSMQMQRAAKEVKENINHRHILSLLVAFAFVIGGIIEQSSSIALLENKNAYVSPEEFAQYVENTSYITRLCSLNRTQQNLTGHQIPKSIPHIEIPMSLNEETESILREAFMWGCLLSPLAASRIAARVGAEQLFGYAILGAGASTALVPAAWLNSAHVALRIFQGMCIGATWPTAHMLAVSWIDKKFISSFISLYTGVNLGYAIGGLFGIPLVQNWGRDSISYTICLMVAIWYFFWWRFYQVVLPFKKPFEKVKHGVPWRHLLSSTPVWICGLTVLGSQWADATMMLCGLRYLKLVYGFSTLHNSVLSFLPNIGHFCAAILFGIVVDHIRATKLVTNTTSRRIFVYISHYLPAAILFVLGYTGCDPSIPAAMYTAALTLSGATSAGSYSCAADLAPEHAGTVFGLCTTMGAAGLLAANYVVREGLHGSIAGWWRLVFGIAAFELFLSGGIFLVCGHACPQIWSSHYTKKEHSDVISDFMKRISIPSTSRGSGGATRGSGGGATGSFTITAKRDSVIVVEVTANSRRNSVQPNENNENKTNAIEIKTISFAVQTSSS